MSNRMVPLAAFLAVILPAGVLAEIQLFDDFPNRCSNERRVFTRVPPFIIGPTWVASCEHYCGAEGAPGKTVWFPTKVCSNGSITAVRCVPDGSRPGCFIVEADRTDPENFDCRAENGEGWECQDRQVEAVCSYRSGDEEKGQLEDFRRIAGHAFCVRK